MPTSYDAFISYSHAADGKLAPALQNALQRFAKPWYRLRALAPVSGPDQPFGHAGAVAGHEQALQSSRYFLLLASPEAAQSRWVQQEVGWWLEHKSSETLLIALTDGKIVRHPGATDFDWETTDALPPNLKGVFVEDPLWVDLRRAKGQEHLFHQEPGIPERAGRPGRPPPQPAKGGPHRGRRQAAPPRSSWRAARPSCWRCC